MKVKIVDVAREANVSVATVSRVVNNIPLVNEETRERVLAAIKKPAISPMPSPAALRSRRPIPWASSSRIFRTRFIRRSSGALKMSAAFTIIISS